MSWAVGERPSDPAPSVTKNGERVEEDSAKLDRCCECESDEVTMVKFPRALASRLDILVSLDRVASVIAPE